MIHITYYSIVTKDSLFLLKRLISIMMILHIDNSSMSYSFTTKYFLCTQVKNHIFFGETMSPIKS